MRLGVAGRNNRADRNFTRVVEIREADIELDVFDHLPAPAAGKAELGRGIGGKLHAVRLEFEIERAAVELDASAHGGLVRR